MYQINGKVFFNATKVWQKFDCPDALNLDAYLRTDSARKLMLQMYGDLKGFEELTTEINILFQNLVKQGFKFRGSKPSQTPKDIEGFLAATNTFRLKKFAPHFEADFVQSVKGAQGGTFLCYDLFLDYCTHLSTPLKLQVFETFKKFGDLTKLEGQALIDALQRKADTERAKLPKFISQVAPTFVREEVKGRTKALQKAIQDMYYSSEEKPNRNMYSHIHNQINMDLFGMSSKNMQKLIALSESSKVLIRDCMTHKAIRLLEQVEAALYVFLTDCRDAGIFVPIEKLNTMLSYTCASVKSLAFLVKSDFHLLQNAIERDYDLLVKNADCVKDVGVVPRPDEICEKGSLMSIPSTVETLGITRRTDSSKSSPSQNKRKGDLQLSLFGDNE